MVTAATLCEHLSHASRPFDPILGSNGVQAENWQSGVPSVETQRPNGSCHLPARGRFNADISCSSLFFLSLFFALRLLNATPWHDIFNHWESPARMLYSILHLWLCLLASPTITHCLSGIVWDPSVAWVSIKMREKLDLQLGKKKKQILLPITQQRFAGAQSPDSNYIPCNTQHHV